MLQPNNNSNIQPPNLMQPMMSNMTPNMGINTSGPFVPPNMMMMQPQTTQATPSSQQQPNLQQQQQIQGSVSPVSSDYGTGAAGGAKVELSVRCTFLVPYDSVYVAFFMMDGQTPDSWREISRTETTRDRSDRVDFATTFLVDYRFEDLQFLKFMVVCTKDAPKVVGEMRCHLGEIVGEDQTLTRGITRIQSGMVENMGTMQILAEESKVKSDEDSEAVVT